MRRIHNPVLLSNVEEARSRAFVLLFTLESSCRASLITLVPLQAYDLLRDALLVSALYLAVSAVGLAVGLSAPMLIHLLTRKVLVTLGAIAHGGAAMLFAVGELWSLVLGLALQISAVAVLEIAINLYLLDHIPRRALNSFEPKRLIFAGSAFIVGPWLGVYLDGNVARDLTYFLVALLALVLLGVFWLLRLSDNPAIQPALKPPPRPLRYIPRFATQPRLVVAWVLAVARNGWWVMFFVYAPIYVTEAGYSAELGGFVVSLGIAAMPVVGLWARLGRRFGIRRLLISSYALAGAVTIAAGLLASFPIVCMGILVLSGIAATVIDGAGNVPFLRAVHPYERTDMTSVFSTYRLTASILAPGLFAAVLLFLPLPFVFVAGGGVMCAMAWLARYLPRGL